MYVVSSTLAFGMAVVLLSSGIETRGSLLFRGDPENGRAGAIDKIKGLKAA